MQSAIAASLILLFVMLLAGPSALAGMKPPATSTDRISVIEQCARNVTTTCLVESIRTYLAPEQYPFSRERVLQALAAAQLFDGQVDQAVASYRQLTRDAGRPSS